MNSLTKQQRNPALQIAGIIQNYRKVTTRTGKPMASFTVGTFPAKCFDVLVDTAEHWAATGKRVLVVGYLSNHDGTIELVAQSFNLASAGQTDAQTDFAQGGYPDTSAQEKAPIRELSAITENLSGCVSNLQIVPTRSARPMVTFRIGNSSCKAFGDLASAIQKAQGKQIAISARKGSFRGVTEYAVEIVKTISGTAVNLRDNSDPASVTAGPTSRVESAQNQRPELVGPKDDERKQIADGIGEPRAGLSEIEDAEDLPGFEPFGPAAYGIKTETIKNLSFLCEPAKLAAVAEAKTVTETTEAPQPEPATTSKPLKESLIRYWIDIFHDNPLRYPEERVKQLSLESGEMGEAAKRTLAGLEAETVTEATIEAPKTAPAEEAATDKTPEVQGVISKIKNLPTKDGRKMVIFKIGPHNCHILGKPAEFVATHAPEFEGKLIRLYGERKLNERGRMAFFPEERIAATDPSGEVTVDEVQKALEQALFEGSDLSSEGGPTFEEMEAEYNQRKRSEQQAKSSAVAA